jgi:hypothetical protein
MEGDGVIQRNKLVLEHVICERKKGQPMVKEGVRGKEKK